MRMRRVLVAGISGAGKTTMARAVASRLRLSCHELDALRFTGPNWAIDPGFAGRMAEIAAAPGWVFDSFGYPEVRDLLWTRADTVIWLDYPRSVIMPRVLRRSLRRTLLRERVFGGNVETWREWFSRHHPAWWAWTQHATRHSEIASRVRDPRFAHLHVVHFTSPREADDWLRSLRPGP
ncbi:hypothetical protein Skr01_16790 [Sphaerisporangium krabiense]|uniref:Adenylate kinase family enzyme n=1 Tax=Sphaerisporangium krabiense TaxID=763782 RepID=A0A7W8YZ18_9ACTN|nr:AAA family ATPase [Sphaerisporangium krabiense]MBB5624449.1 adenylate kinase family enzyme [Sphaerisporangium krabiense]GII61594.1 hypothetical protein Skr01_16790 [Sphaerisporangium krabiense]